MLGGFSTLETLGCVALFVTLGFAHEKPTHLEVLSSTNVKRGLVVRSGFASEPLGHLSPYRALTLSRLQSGRVQIPITIEEM